MVGVGPLGVQSFGRGWAFKDRIGLCLAGLIVGLVVLIAVLSIPVLSVVLDEIVVVVMLESVLTDAQQYYYTTIYSSNTKTRIRSAGLTEGLTD